MTSLWVLWRICGIFRAINFELYEFPHAPHDVFLTGNLLGWSREAMKGGDEAARAAYDFWRAKLSRHSFVYIPDYILQSIQYCHNHYCVIEITECYGFPAIRQRKHKDSCSFGITRAEVGNTFDENIFIENNQCCNMV
jgi:hypothetical protein